jgi:hypothetical protein
MLETQPYHSFHRHSYNLLESLTVDSTNRSTDPAKYVLRRFVWLWSGIRHYQILFRKIDESEQRAFTFSVHLVLETMAELSFYHSRVLLTHLDTPRDKHTKLCFQKGILLVRKPALDQLALAWWCRVVNKTWRCLGSPTKCLKFTCTFP